MRYLVIGGVLALALSAHAATTMQNDTESIALPSTVTGGQQTVIFDNPDLINEWVAGANQDTDYYASIGTAFLVTQTGAATLTVGNPATSAGDALASFLGADSGFSFSTPAYIGSGGSAAGTKGAGGVIISGSKLREALKAKGILTIDIPGWDFDDTAYIDDSEFYVWAASIDTGDLAAIAAAIVFRDQNIEEVRIDGGVLSVTYRTKGWLFWFIPIHFTVSLNINVAGTTDAERVQVRYPWYRIFAWLPVSPSQLAGNLNASIIGIQAAKLNTEEAQARMFTYVSALLRSQGASDILPQ